jgi:hypothetical protein
MEPIDDTYTDLKSKADYRYDNFRIEEITSIKRIYEESYLESPVWIGGDEKFVCLFIDLDSSSKMSYKKHPKTMAKIYDYFTQTLIDTMSLEGIDADYIDIKGDGAFGIFEGQDAAFRALSAALTFGTFFRKYIRPKFQDDQHIFNFKSAISVDKLLVKRIGKRGPRNNNEVWAGRLINNASKLATLSKDIYSTDFDFDPSKGSMLVVSESIYQIFETKREFAVMHCGHDLAGNPQPPSELWREYSTTANDEIHDDRVFYAPGLWCDICQDTVNEGLLS